MSLELLRELSSKRLPCTIASESGIDQLRVLRAAGYIAALLPGPGSTSEMGRVLAITRTGREALSTLPEHVHH